MAPKPMVQVEGAKELARAARKANDKTISDELKAAHKASAEVVEQAARPMIPRLSGLLESSLRSGATLRSGRVSIGKKAVPYAGPIHFGWPARNIAPQPFLYDAVDSRRDEALRRFEEMAANVAEQVMKDSRG